MVVRHPKAEGYNVRINSEWFRTVASKQAPIVVGTRDSLAPRQDDSGTIYNNVLDIGYAFGRTDLSGGEGLDWDPRKNSIDRELSALDAIRFWDSANLNVSRPDQSGQEYNLRLSYDDKPWVGNGTLIAPTDMAASSNFVYISDGESVYRYSSWDDPTPVNVGIPNTPDLVLAIAVSPNDTVMALMDTGEVYAEQPSNPGVWELAYDNKLATLNAKGIWYTAGRFIVGAFDEADASTLSSLDWDGDAWQESVFDSASGEYNSVVQSGPAVVSACADGTVRTYTPDNANDGDMSLRPRARTTMPDGEIPILLGANAGILLILTAQDVNVVDTSTTRLYQSEVLPVNYDFSVGSLQLKREWLTTTFEPDPNRNMGVGREQIFFYVNERLDNSNSEALWSFDVVTLGLHRRHYEDSASVNLNALTTFDSIIGGIDFGNPGDIVVENPLSHKTEGYMILPNMTFGLNTPIAWLTTVIEARNIFPGSKIELWRSTDPRAILNPNDPSWVIVTRLTSDGESGDETPLVNLNSRTLTLQVKVFSDGTTTPRITRIGIRGIPSHRDFIMQIPFNVSDYVSAPGRRPQRIPGLGQTLHNRVLDRVGTNVEVAMIDPAVLFRGVLNNVSEPVELQSARGSVTRYCNVEFRGQRLVATAQPTGDGGVGLGLLGITPVGIGQEENL
jgi:hypothetical protein